MTENCWLCTNKQKPWTVVTLLWYNLWCIEIEPNVACYSIFHACFMACQKIVSMDAVHIKFPRIETFSSAPFTKWIACQLLYVGLPMRDPPFFCFHMISLYVLTHKMLQKYAADDTFKLCWFYKKPNKICRYYQALFSVKILIFCKNMELIAKLVVCCTLTLCLLVLSADITFANSFGPVRARQNVGPDLDPNCLTLY